MPERRKYRNKYQFDTSSFGKSYNSRNILTGVVQKKTLVLVTPTVYNKWYKYLDKMKTSYIIQNPYFGKSYRNENIEPLRGFRQCSIEPLRTWFICV